MTDYMTYELPDLKGEGIVARWWGGEYIELGYVTDKDLGPFNDLGQPSYEAGEWVALDVINVWDYETGAPRIERTLDAFRNFMQGRDDGSDPS